MAKWTGCVAHYKLVAAFAPGVLGVRLQVYATASEDMDSLTFGTKILLRHLTFSEARKEPIVEIHHDKVLQGLEMSQDEVRSYPFAFMRLSRGPSRSRC